MTMPRLPLLALLCALAATVQPASSAELVCHSDWSVAAPVVEEQGLASVETVKEAARSRVRGDIIKVLLCQDVTRYVYRLVVRTPEGQHQSVDVDARAPFADK